MKTILILLLTISCAHKSSLKDVDNDLYQMTRSQMKSLPDSLWPGFKDYTPLVIYNTLEGQYLLGTSKYPIMGYNEFNPGHKHPLGEEFQEIVYNTAFPKEIFQRHYPMLTSSVFMIDSLERMKSLGRDWNKYDWSTIYIHEIFHLFQGSRWSKDIIEKDEIIDSEPLQKLRKDKKNIQLILEEQKTVKNALLKLDFTDKEHVKEMCIDLINKRTSRYRYIKRQIKHSISNEQFYETLEGTARYIEKHIDLYSRLDPDKRKYMNKDLLGHLDKYGINTYFYMLDQIELGENYYYETGFGLSLLLDKLDSKWKEEAFKNTLWEQFLERCKSI